MICKQYYTQIYLEIFFCQQSGLGALVHRGSTMKRGVLAGMGALAMVTLVGAANAADLPRRHAMPTKPPVYVEPGYNRTCFYAGINGG